MGARKNANGRWEQQFTTPPDKLGVKKRMYVVCPPDYNNPTFLKQLVRDAIDRHLGGISSNQITFEAYVRERFMVEYPAAKGLRDSSRELLHSMLEKIAIPELGSIPLIAIDTSTLARFTAKLKDATRISKKDGEVKKRFADYTVRHILIAVTSVLRWAKRTGEIHVSPDVSLPRVANAIKPQPYTAEEAQALIAACDTAEEKALFLLAFDAGLRKSEILGLSWGQIDFAQHLIIVDRQRYRGAYRQTKGGRARKVEMSEELESLLASLPGSSAWAKLGRAFGARDEVFMGIGEDGKPEPRNEYWVRWIFTRARRRAGLRKTRFHDARHRYASERTEEGVSTFALQALLGHADVRTTQGYVHTSAARPRSILDKTNLRSKTG